MVFFDDCMNMAINLCMPWEKKYAQVDVLDVSIYQRKCKDKDKELGVDHRSNETSLIIELNAC